MRSASIAIALAVTLLLANPCSMSRIPGLPPFPENAWEEISTAPQTYARGDFGKGSTMPRHVTVFEKASSISDLPNHMWHMPIALPTGLPRSELVREGEEGEASAAASAALLSKAKEVMSNVRVCVDWGLCRIPGPFLGGELVLSDESLSANLRLRDGPGIPNDIHLFLPSALGLYLQGREKGTSDGTLGQSIYTLAAKARIRILSCNAFQLSKVQSLLGMRRLTAHSLQGRLPPQRDDALHVVLRVRSHHDEWLNPCLPRGSLLERVHPGQPSLATCEDVCFTLAPGQLREVVIECMLLKPSPVLPTGRRNLTPFAVCFPEDVAIDPMECQGTFWMYRGLNMDEARASHMRLKDATARELQAAVAAGVCQAEKRKLVWDQNEESFNVEGQHGEGAHVKGSKSIEEGKSEVWGWSAAEDEDEKGGGGRGEGVESADARVAREMKEIQDMLARLPFRDNITVYDPLPIVHPFRNLTLESVLADAKYGSHLLGQRQEGGGVGNVAAVEDEDEEDWVVIKDEEPIALPGLGKHQLEAAMPPRAQRSGLSKEGMAQVLAMVSSHADAGPFKLPVTRKQAPDYRIIVKRPMALSNVKSSLEKGEYSKPGGADFVEDMELVFRNAMQYNMDGSAIHDMAKRLHRFFWTCVYRSGKRPNVLVTGTPGTGKTTTVKGAVALASRWGYGNVTVINVGDVIRAERLGVWNDTDECYEVDEESESRLLDMLEGMLADGGCLVEYHSSSLFPKRWFKHVVVLTCDNEVLYKRLVQRGYPQHKVQGQVECEIMRVPLDEALEAYPVPGAVTQLVSETAEQVQANAIEIASLFHVPSASSQMAADSQEREGAERAPVVNLTGLMWDVWSSVANHADAEIFMNPVTKREAPNYHTIIKTPMSLSVVKTRLSQTVYTSDRIQGADHFVDDMDLIFRNALVYNADGSVIHEMAKRLQRHMWMSACRLVALIAPTPPPESDDVVVEAKDQGADVGMGEGAEVGEGGGECMGMDNGGGIERGGAVLQSGASPVLQNDHDDDGDDDGDDDIEVVDVDDDDKVDDRVVESQPAADTGLGGAGGGIDDEDAVAAIGGMSNGGVAAGEGVEGDGRGDDVSEKIGQIGIAGGPRKRRKK